MGKIKTIFITAITTTVVCILIVLGIVYYIYFKNKKNFFALRNTIYNDRICPINVNQGLYYCPYKNIELNPPGEQPEFNILSFYLANLIGKLENKYPFPIQVLMNIYINSNKDLFGVLLKGENVLYIIYRGTRTLDEWKKDFSYYQRAESTGNSSSNIFYSQRTLDTSTLKMNLLESKVLIHEGFLDIYNSFKAELLEKINSYGDIPIVVSGHSLGAGVATITAFNLKSLGKNVTSIVFASPRVGNQAFADILNNGGFHYQWINSSDVIPTLPYSVSPNFLNINDPYIYTHGGKIFYFTLNKESLINNHTISTYIQYINSIVND